MFEQFAALENQFKTPMSDSVKIAIAIKKLPAEHQPVLTAEMRKEGGMLMASHIVNATFQYWQSVHTRILSSMWQTTKIWSQAKKLHLRNLQQMWSKRT